MKTVTIPTSQSPFVVMVNGAKYVYPAGSVQDVPDEVAVVIEAHNKQTAKPNEPVEAPFDCDCGGGGGTQPDWNQTDSSAADFIKNKPFGDMPAASLPETEVTAVVQDGMNVVPLDESLFSGKETKLVVGFDGIEYSCTAKDAMDFPAFGNMKYFGGDDTGEPFCVLVAIGFGVMLVVDDTEPHTVSIKRYVINKIQPVYFDSFHKFYTIPGNYTTYLFNDSECSQKVTAEEFIAVAKTQNFQIISSVSGIEVFASTPLFFSKIIDQNNMYCYVDVFWSEDGGGSIERKRYYTAEYTPTT